LNVEPQPSVRPLARLLRRVLVLNSVLAAIAGADLYFASNVTDDYFAWTIRPFLTAAFLGGNYLAAAVLLALCARARTWAGARVGTIGAQTLIALILLAMLVHIDRFHTGSRDPVTFFATWSFIGTYVVVPPLTALAIVVQLRVPGCDPPRQRRLPLWFLGLLATQGAIATVVGAALVIAPTDADSLWPWTLTPLTGRAVGAFVLATGVSALLGVRENDWARVSPALMAYGLLGSVQLIALARYSGEPNWEEPTAWIYVLFVLSILVTGAAGAVSAYRVSRPPTERIRSRP
jgi:hypothetical protein